MFKCNAQDLHVEIEYIMDILYTPYISRGFYFREFRESVLFANSTTRENKLTSDPSIALLLDREFTHSRKCLEVPIREKLDSRNIWRRVEAPVNGRSPVSGRGVQIRAYRTAH